MTLGRDVLARQNKWRDIRFMVSVKFHREEVCREHQECRKSAPKHSVRVHDYESPTQRNSTVRTEGEFQGTIRVNTN